jgi:uncharacterized membrane protein
MMILFLYGHTGCLSHYRPVWHGSRDYRGGPHHLRGIQGCYNGGFAGTFKKPAFTYNQVRRDFTDEIVFGLEFLIAADILATLLSPSQQDLINLAVVVVIRTVLGDFLSKEAAEFNLQ